MMDPGMMGAPMPPEAAMPAPPMDPMGAVAPVDPMAGAAPSAVELVLAALGAWEQEKQGEMDVVLAAVMKATSAGMPAGIEGASEGAAFGAPDMGAPVPPMLGGL